MPQNIKSAYATVRGIRHPVVSVAMFMVGSPLKTKCDDHAPYRSSMVTTSFNGLTTLINLAALIVIEHGDHAPR